MMLSLIVLACAITLLGAALLELVCVHKGNADTGVSSFLMAFACAGLSARLLYLWAMNDIGRVSPWGALPIICMAWARVLACSVLIWRKP